MNLENNTFYKLWWGGDTFGDRLSVAVVVQILSDNGIKCAIDMPPIHRLVDVPKASDPQFKGLTGISHRMNRTKQRDPTFNIHTDLIHYFIKSRNLPYELEDINLTLDHVPVIYHEIDKIIGVDVAIASQAGNWTPYKAWPYFKELKHLFNQNDISYIDLSEKEIKNFEFLNYVKKSKIYLGLDTGTSHYASKFIKHKGFIIQGGFTTFEYWGSLYNYQKIESPVSCSPCYKRKGCEYSHACMANISAQHVYEVIKQALINYDKS